MFIIFVNKSVFQVFFRKNGVNRWVDVVGIKGRRVVQECAVQVGRAALYDSLSVIFHRPPCLWQLLFHLGRTFGTIAHQHVVGRNESETFGQRYGRHRQSAQAESASAVLAAEVRVQVVKAVVFILATATFGRTERIFLYACAVFDAVYQMV